MVFYGSSGEGSRLRCHQPSYVTGLHETLWDRKSQQLCGDKLTMSGRELLTPRPSKGHTERAVVRQAHHERLGGFRFPKDVESQAKYLRELCVLCGEYSFHSFRTIPGGDKCQSFPPMAWIFTTK